MPPLFPASNSTPGHGDIHITLLPPGNPSFSKISYSYPLKLLSSTPHVLESDSEMLAKESMQDVPPVDRAGGCLPPITTSLRPTLVPLVFILTYGGGLLAGDCINLKIRLDPCTRLVAATQGSTRVYKMPIAPSTSLHIDQAPSFSEHQACSFSKTGAVQNLPHALTSRQDLCVRICRGAGFWLAPDPIQPFAGSLYAQTQIFEVENGASVGVIDWVTEGRRARGESWAMAGWKGKNEIWGIIPAHTSESGPQAIIRKERRILMVRDSVILEPDGVNNCGGISPLVANAGVFGTLILYGPLFVPLARFFLGEFTSLPRIGERNWNDSDGNENADILSSRQRWKKNRVAREKADGVLWTAAEVRGGVTVVKFSAREVEGARAWMGEILREEGSVGRDFGEGGLMFLR